MGYDASLLRPGMEAKGNFEMSYEALSTYIKEETSVFLQVCCAKERDVVKWENV